jgi:hypothetical protein
MNRRKGRGNNRKGGKNNNKAKDDTNNDRLNNNASEGKKEKWKVKFPCKLCKDDHLTNLCPKIKESSRLLSQPVGSQFNFFNCPKSCLHLCLLNFKFMSHFAKDDTFISSDIYKFVSI